jgi:hypothetical protein
MMLSLTGHGNLPLLSSNFAAKAFASGLKINSFFLEEGFVLDLDLAIAFLLASAMASLIILSIFAASFFSLSIFFFKSLLYFPSFFLIVEISFS